MKIGVTISLHQTSIWSSGINQNAIYMAMLLRDAGHEVTLITSMHKDTGSYKEVLEVVERENVFSKDVESAQTDYFDVLIDLGFWFNNEWIENFKRYNPKIKVVQYSCGNTFFVDSEILLYKHNEGRTKDYENTDPRKQRYTPDQVWMIPQMENVCKDWYKYTSGCKKATVVPFVWDPASIDEYNTKKGYEELQPGPISKIAVMESNISLMKHFLPMLVTVEELLDRGVELEHVYLVGAEKFKDNKRLMQLLRGRKMMQKGVISADPRIPTMRMVHEYKALVLSYQMENPLNYLYLDAAWTGAPVVHNAHLCQDVGYYYEGFQFIQAADVVQRAMQEYPTDLTYKSRMRETIKRYTRHNENMLKQYNELLDNLVNDKFVEMKYNWQDNSVSPI